MAHKYLTLKANPTIVRIVDEFTKKVVGTVGTQPTTFVENDWNDEGYASFATAQENVSKVFADFRKPDLKKDQRANAKRVYDAVLAAGNSIEVAKQVSGY